MAKRCLPCRCGLCLFDFLDGDHVFVIEGDKKSGPFQRRGRFFKDRDGGNAHVACLVPCIHHANQAVGCHLACVKLVAPSARLAEHLKMTAYSLDPLPYQERGRRRWLHSRLECALEQSVPLPSELRREIGRYLLQEYAVMTNSSLLKHPQDFACSVSDLASLRQRYVLFEGERYLSSLILEEGHQQKQIPSPAMSRAIYISEDHRGIKRLVFSNSGRAPNVGTVPGVWWKALPTAKPNAILTFHHDGLKMRHLSYSDGETQISTATAPSFDYPRQVSAGLRVSPFDHVSYKSPYRLARFQTNTPDLTGFSVCCGPLPITLHAHTPKDDLSFYEPVLDSSVWIYLPRQQGESIMEIWMRGHLHFRDSHSLALAFVTNRRSVLLGAAPTPRLSQCPWYLLDTPNGNPSNVYFDSYPHGITSFAFDSSKPPPGPLQPLTLPQPLSSHPDIHANFHWSSASVDHVAEISICRRPSRDTSEILGLMLHYADGNRACLGQVRLDCLDPPFVVTPSQSLHLGSKTTAGKGPHIVRACISGTDEDRKSVEGSEIDIWFEVVWSGTVEWWFTDKQCHVWQDGRHSFVL
ncbi:hypothetical protein F66182_6646 [Fusarium sp. NRRL 66182]|nr:hypothetical protein F66182_6646 [Fusarium sp. NRRL 66182]